MIVIGGSAGELSVQVLIRNPNFGNALKNYAAYKTNSYELQTLYW